VCRFYGYCYRLLPFGNVCTDVLKEVQMFSLVYENNYLGTFDSIRKGLKAIEKAFDDDFNFAVFKESYEDCLECGGEKFESFKDVCETWEIIVKEN
jgi:hypothetical protein